MLNKIILTLFIALGTITSCTDPAESEYEMALSKAQSAMVNKQWNRALSFYRQAAKVKPDAPGIKQKIDSISELILREKEEKKVTYLRNSADSLFNAGNYSRAKSLYQELNFLRPEDTGVQDRIAEIESILLNATAEPDAFPVATRAYHVIVGSFLVPVNADRMQSRLSRNGYRPVLISRPGGFTAVSIEQFPGWQEAIEHLGTGKRYAPDAWILKH